MKELAKITYRMKLIKYCCLSTSIGIVVLMFTVLYIQSNLIDNQLQYKYRKDLLKDNNLTIKNPLFKSLDKSSSPYIIKAKRVIKNRYNKYLLNFVEGEYTVQNTYQKAVIKSDNAILDEVKKTVQLNNNVVIVCGSIMYYGKEILFDLDTKDIISSSRSEITFKNSKIQADRFKAKNSTDIVEFEGNINFSLNLS